MRRFKIGQIVNTQGIGGEVRVLPATDDPARFGLLIGRRVRLEKGAAAEEYFISAVRYNKRFVIVKFEGVNDMTAAEALKGMDITIGEELALPLEADEYYHQDLYGMDVYTEGGQRLGVITGIIQTGANDVYSVTTPEKAEILIPAIKQCVLDVDVPARRMLVRLMDGML